MPVVTIQKIDFELPSDLPYTEGHVLNEREASVLNQTWAENLRNNFATRIKSALETEPQLSDETLATLRDEFTEYALTYEFAKRTPKVAADPVAAEAYKIAKAAVVSALKGKGIDTKNFPAAKLDDLVTGLLAKRPEYHAEAARRIAATKAASAELVDLLDGVEDEVPAEAE